MKNPFRKRKAETAAPIPSEPVSPADAAAKVQIPDPVITDPSPVAKADQPADSFTEWCRSQVRGGIERRDRNDIYEAYNVYGADGDQPVCRRWHRYPEHEREFSLSYSRNLSFNDFNRRLLEELDRGDLRLDTYHDAIARAEKLSSPDGDDDAPSSDSFTDEEQEILQAFCDGMDHLKDQRYLHLNGVLCCECESAAGGVRLNLRMRKPLRHDALYQPGAGVIVEPMYGYDIEDMWILGVYNRLYERAASCKVFRLTSAWSLRQESVLLILADGFPGVDGEVIFAVGESDSFRRFGFYSLDFSNS